ncbi:MAG: hypothetical protein C0433_18305 [Cyclobacterium sp.]|nr:hypothetical protein [Cyclobacterium sp.]
MGWYFSTKISGRMQTKFTNISFFLVKGLDQVINKSICYFISEIMWEITFAEQVSNHDINL